MWCDNLDNVFKGVKLSATDLKSSVYGLIVETVESRIFVPFSIERAWWKSDHIFLIHAYGVIFNTCLISVLYW